MQYSDANHYPTSRANSAFALAPYQMTSSQYLAEVVAVCVYPLMEQGTLRLACADPQSEDNMDRFAAAVVPMAPASERDKKGWARRSVNSLLDQPFQDDCWYSHTPGYPPIVMIKLTAIEGMMSLEDAVRRSHMCQVADALSAGLDLPLAVQEEYRLQLEAMSQREMH